MTPSAALSHRSHKRPDSGFGPRVSGLGTNNKSSVIARAEPVEGVAIYDLLFSFPEAGIRKSVSQTKIATPREARLAMTFFSFSDPEAGSPTPGF